MKIQPDENFFENYNDEERLEGEKVIDNIRISDRLLKAARDYDLSLYQLETIERLAEQVIEDAPDVDIYFAFCQGFAMGRAYAKDHPEN